MSSKPKLTCKKCGGNHLTIKCGKNKTRKNTSPKYDNKKQHWNKDNGKSYPRRNNYTNHNRRDRRDRRDRGDNIPKVCVRINNLPYDMDVSELNMLMQDWGRIGRINIKNYNRLKTDRRLKTAYIDFYSKSHAEYFRDAVDKTPMDYHILNVEILDK